MPIRTTQITKNLATSNKQKLLQAALQHNATQRTFLPKILQTLLFARRNAEKSTWSINNRSMKLSAVCIAAAFPERYL